MSDKLCKCGHSKEAHGITGLTSTCIMCDCNSFQEPLSDIGKIMRRAKHNTEQNQRIAQLERELQEQKDMNLKAYDNGYVSGFTQAHREIQRDAAELAKALAEATLSIADWAAYAGDYFQDKHGLEDELKSFGRVLSENAKYLEVKP